MEIKLLKISDFQNDFNLLLEECYNCYLSIWQNELVFNNKPIIRNKNLDKEKEQDFWGIVEGHSNHMVFEGLLRYETLPILKYILQEVSKTTNNDFEDIIWFYSERRRVNILSKKLKYLIILHECEKINRFITAFPVNEIKVQKIKYKWQTYWQNQYPHE